MSTAIIPVLVRVLVYVLSTVAGLIPAAWAGWVDYVPASGVITISVEGLATAIVVGLSGSFGIFAKWGKW